MEVVSWRRWRHTDQMIDVGVHCTVQMMEVVRWQRWWHTDQTMEVASQWLDDGGGWMMEVAAHWSMMEEVGWWRWSDDGGGRMIEVVGWWRWLDDGSGGTKGPQMSQVSGLGNWFNVSTSHGGRSLRRYEGRVGEWNLCLPSVWKSRGFLLRTSVGKPEEPRAARQRTGTAPGTTVVKGHRCHCPSSCSTQNHNRHFSSFAAWALASSAKWASGSSDYWAAVVYRWEDWGTEMVNHLPTATRQAHGPRSAPVPLTTWYCLVYAEAMIPFLTNSSFPETGSRSRDVFSSGRSWRKQMLRDAPSPAALLSHTPAPGRRPTFTRGSLCSHPRRTWAARLKRLASPLTTSLAFFSWAGSRYCTCCKRVLWLITQETSGTTSPPRETAWRICKPGRILRGSWSLMSQNRMLLVTTPGSGPTVQMEEELYEEVCGQWDPSARLKGARSWDAYIIQGKGPILYWLCTDWRDSCTCKPRGKQTSK